MEVNEIVRTAAGVDGLRRALDITTGVAVTLLIVGVIDFLRQMRPLGMRRAFSALRSVVTRHPAETFASHMLTQTKAIPYVRYVPLHRYVGRLLWLTGVLVGVYAVVMVSLMVWTPPGAGTASGMLPPVVLWILRELLLPGARLLQEHALLIERTVVLIGVLNMVVAIGLAKLIRVVGLVATQPRLVLAPPGMPGYGVVYDALRKLPVPLAIVQLVRAEDGRVLATRVTDLMGRYRFPVFAGRYRLVARAPHFQFPSRMASGKSVDRAFPDVVGADEVLQFRAQGMVTRAIPIDPKPDTRLPFHYSLSVTRARMHALVSFLCVAVSLCIFLVMADVRRLAVVAVMMMLLLAIALMSERRRASVLGVVRDARSGMPIPGAAVYLWDNKHEQSLDVQVTDRLGTYGFVAGRGAFRVSVTKAGYPPTADVVVDCSREPTAVCAVAPDVRLGASA